MWPLDSSTGVPEESGVCWPFLAHHSMKFTAHPFPAPGRFRLEAEQLFRERFLFHCRIIYSFVLKYQMSEGMDPFSHIMLYAMRNVTLDVISRR